MSGVLAFGVLLTAGAASVEAGYFRADNLHDCVGFTRDDLQAAPEGTELPFAGIRLFAKDHQRGGTVTICLTMPYAAGRFCCSGDPRVVMPERMRKNAESMRFVVAEGCSLVASLHNWSNSLNLKRSLYHSPEYGAAKWRNKSIPDPYDNRLTWFEGGFACWDGLL